MIEEMKWKKRAKGPEVKGKGPKGPKEVVGQVKEKAQNARLGIGKEKGNTGDIGRDLPRLMSFG